METRMTLKISKIIALVLVAVCVGTILAVAAFAGQQVPTSPLPPKSFATPQEAAQALIRAAAVYDVRALTDLFGADGKDLISSADPVRDKSIAASFASLAAEKNLVTVDPRNPSRAILTLGSADWPMPIPLMKRNGKWFFDAT